MTKRSSTVEFSEPLALAGLEERWNQGDQLALTEAIALCHVNDWPFPNWGTRQIGETMTEVFRLLFPDALSDQPIESNNNKTEIPHDSSELADRFKKASERAAHQFGLKQQGTGVVEKSRKRCRDIELAFLIAEDCRFDPMARNCFIGVEDAKARLAGTISEARDTRKWPGYISIECRDATEAVINHAWKRNAGFVKKAHAMLPADRPGDQPDDSFFE